MGGEEGSGVLTCTGECWLIHPPIAVEDGNSTSGEKDNQNVRIPSFAEIFRA
jgi:hypothetical protein